MYADVQISTLCAAHTHSWRYPTLTLALQLMKQLRTAPYDEGTRTGALRYLQLTAVGGDSTGARAEEDVLSSVQVGVGVHQPYTSCVLGVRLVAARKYAFPQAVTGTALLPRARHRRNRHLAVRASGGAGRQRGRGTWLTL